MRLLITSNLKYFTAGYHSTVGVYGFRPRLSIPFTVSEDALRNRKHNCSLYLLAIAFKEHGHKIASLNPLENNAFMNIPQLDPLNYNLDINSQDKFSLDGIVYSNNKKEATISEITDELKKIYCDKIGVEFQYLNENEKEWFSNEFEKSQVETKFSDVEKTTIASELLKSQVFDNFLATKYSTVKRYGGEGAESMIAFFMEIFKQSCLDGINEIVIGIPHRGRLNLLTGLLKFPPVLMFKKMKGLPEYPKDINATGDVLSHLASSVDVECGNESVHVTLLPCPSHLEMVTPVTVGYSRGLLQTQKCADYNISSKGSQNFPILPVQVHGDASFTGQGVVMETVSMSNVPHFHTGGSVHLVVNNQIGFTTPQYRGRSSAYCSDIMKMIPGPVIHVNGDYPEDVIKATRLALRYRQQFQKDVLIDLLCFRRWGHNEMDDPTFTNPLMYKTVHSRKSVPDIYTQNLIDHGILHEKQKNDLISNYHSTLNAELKQAESYEPETYGIQKEFRNINQSEKSIAIWDTGVPLDLLKFVGVKSVEIPENVVVHPNLVKNFIEDRKTKLLKGSNLDWATSEALAIGSLLYQGHNVRISGQDVGRGTFSHRHAMLVDQATNEMCIPLNKLSDNQTAYYEVANSILSEEGVLGFEYGFSVANVNNLVIWEAQFGDFFNSAQVVFDTCISSGEKKWLLQSGIVILLPHGFDGAGPEHSSCRLERFLQMCDSHENEIDSDDMNWRIVNPTTPAQYFHLLRRQIVSKYRKPLIVAAPKILLRHPSAVSSLADMVPGTHFRPVINDPNATPSSVKKVVFCTGKHFYLLQKEIESRKIDGYAIVRLEELCPFPAEEIFKVMKSYTNVKDFIWSQEEHRNMGAWSFVKNRFENLFGYKLKYAGRKELAAVAVGVGKLHQQEISDVLNATFIH